MVTRKNLPSALLLIGFYVTLAISVLNLFNCLLASCAPVPWPTIADAAALAWCLSLWLSFEAGKVRRRADLDGEY